jgi:hypothetical protein
MKTCAPFEIVLDDSNLGTIVVAANRSLEVAHREYMRLRQRFPGITSEAIGTAQRQIVDALKTGNAIPDEDPALQIAAFYEHAVGTAVKIIKTIQRGEGSGITVANLYLLLAQQTGFLMALDAQARGDLSPEAFNAVRVAVRKEASQVAHDARHEESRKAKQAVLDAWASGTFKSKNQCAKVMSEQHGINESTARNYLDKV